MSQQQRTELEAALLAKRTKQIELSPRVKVFLGSISRNSIKSKRSYSSGLSLLQNFLNDKGQQQKYQGNCETILQYLSENKVNVYELLDSFVSYILATKPEITPNSISLYLTAIRSYFAFYDIDVIPSKFRRKVKVPKRYREDEEPIDVNDIRKILLNCNNRRLKSYLLVLASGGMRAVEATATRLKDIDFSVNPTKVHIRKEYSKTRVARDIYISDEATQYLKQWIDWKYRDRAKEKDKGLAKTANPDDLVFSSYKINKRANPNNLYVKLYDEFQKLLAVVGMAERKENGIQKRRKITLHTFRRHAKSVISNQVNQDYSEWFLGHSKSPYYTLRMHTLQNIAQVYNIAVVITNQIQTNPDEWTNNSDIPVGGNIIAHSSTFRIRLHGSNPDKISAKLMTSPCYPQDDIRFAINDRGIADVTDD